MAKYVIRFFCEWGGGCLWAENDGAFAAFGVGPIDLRDPCPLPLTAEVLRRCEELTQWHDTAHNWEYPPDPGPWRQDECDRFNESVKELVDAIRAELGDQFEVVNQQHEVAEDPDLDAYLANRKRRSRRT